MELAAVSGVRPKKTDQHYGYTIIAFAASSTGYGLPRSNPDWHSMSRDDLHAASQYPLPMLGAPLRLRSTHAPVANVPASVPRMPTSWIPTGIPWRPIAAGSVRAG